MHKLSNYIFAHSCKIIYFVHPESLIILRFDNCLIFR